ncbi:HK97 gp10 family phage protein [Cohnella luojiensis]|uniref:HK97 gp10 family phage protein n=2 Tax=Cohnella luojiensis TaxID=652876 RepID=A0A4Y8M6J6_9BACL|nr:HK97 gp10 family phage protein [Cohnella luojiensis]
MRELERAIRRLGQVPQRSVTKAARAGGSIALRAAKRNAPVDEGNLKKGLIMKAERRVTVGKKVYDIMPDPRMNDVFVKVSESGERSYYPASQEFGYLTESGHYIPGYRYMARAVEDNSRTIQRKIIDTATTDIDRAWRGR